MTPTNDSQTEQPTHKPAAKPAPKPISPIRRIARFIAITLDLALLGAVLCWLLGRLISDRYLWSQYLGWIPTEAVVILAITILILGVLLRGKRPRLLVTIATLALVAWLTLAEWRAHRYILPGPERGDLRVLFMNISPRGRDATLQPLFDTEPDIAILSNVHPQPITFEKIYGVRHQDLLTEFTGIVPGDAPPGEAHLVRYGMFHIFSAHPIRRRASAHVGNQESWLANDTGGGGAVLMLEIDTPSGPKTIWALDMPSTVGAARRALFEEARTKTLAVERVLTIDTMGRWIAGDLAPGDPLRTPDLIVGDFNTPAHAWSVEAFSPSTRNARTDAGAGPPGTFPATEVYAPFEIDIARLGDNTRATHLAKIRAEGCRHFGLLLDLDLE